MSALEARGACRNRFGSPTSDRNAAVERINAFFGEGRLDFEETSARLDEIYAARTDVELEQAFRGLPKARPPPSEPGAVPRRGAPGRAGGHPGRHLHRGLGDDRRTGLLAGVGVVRHRRRRSSGTLRGHRRTPTATIAGLTRSVDAEGPGLGPAPATGGSILTAVFADIVGLDREGRHDWVTDGGASCSGASSTWSTASFDRPPGPQAVHQGRRGGRHLPDSPAAGDRVRRGRSATASPGPELELRVGIHTGEVEGHQERPQRHRPPHRPAGVGQRGGGRDPGVLDRPGPGPGLRHRSSSIAASTSCGACRGPGASMR